MSNSLPVGRRPRVLFFGMQSEFSVPSLRALLASDIEVCAIVVPLSNGMTPRPPAIRRREPPRVSHAILPLLNSSMQTSLFQTAWEQHIPVWEVARLSDPETLSVLVTYQSDIICVACFAQRVPRVVLDVPRLGCLNVHPSLLPTNRGPVPLFWTFREGQEQTGVTIHLMDEGMDTGDLLIQEVTPVPDSIGYAELEARCATLGGVLLARAVWELYQGRAVRHPQDESSSSYHSFPGTDDFLVPVSEWSARHVYNFICGMRSYGTSVTLRAGDDMLVVSEAISYRQIAPDEKREGSQVGDDEGWVRCREGWVKVRLAMPNPL